MQRFEKILFVNQPATTATTAFQRAVRLARSNAAQLTIVGVSQEIPRTLINLQKTFLQLQDRQLESLTEGMDMGGIEVRTRALIGTPFLEIIKEVMSGGYDLVIKPAEGRGGLSNILFGSTDLHLLRKCPCPVWIIKPSKRKQFARILAAVDPDPAEAANAELNTLILDLATSLASRENSELHIVHIWSMPYEHTLRSGRVPLPKAEVDRMVRDARKTHKQWLYDLLGNYTFEDIRAKIHLLKGKPGEVIPALAQQKRVELLVMGTVARTGIPGFFIGNTAEKTLSAVDCSVLALKPKGFSTPVEA
jgi:nucleotide-binding universal stress UspA family protein